MEQPNRFQKLVAEAKKNITEITPAEAQGEVERGAVLIDVREEESFREEHLPGAKHLTRGMVELEIEDEVPDLNQPIIIYCGGGSRGALATESLQKMGYTNVRSIRGGLRAWKAEGRPTE
ncbi:MAG: rhodanese-like domain-containing protein [Verrucomicrobiota bacterium]|nr:rhodanese-like domain-containing protein [Verrucomicrobiota bacterium]